ncbi:beta-alanine-activating enzyme isoform X2 [Brienomyrus brachyistius]|nr:beta-alanine-activating enzyme isoform X2 [Brienomyrus brachyistius]
MPIDLDAPSQQSVRIMEKCGLEFSVIQSDLFQSFLDVFSDSVSVDICSEWPSQGLTLVRIQSYAKQQAKHGEAAEHSATSAWRCRAGLVGLAYVLHTSGTTGLPKAVKVPHQCIVPNITHLRSLFQVTASDVIFMASPLTFDPSVVEMFLALSSGACLLIVPTLIKRIPSKLVNVLFANHKTTVLQATPTLLARFGRNILQGVLLSEASSLRVLALGGEACPPLSLLRSWRQQGNTTRVYNLYGITEVSCWASCYEIPARQLATTSTTDGSSVPLGTPLMGTTMEVKDERGCVVTEGEGQVYIGGERRVCYLGDETEVVPGTMRRTGDWVEVKNSHLYFVGRRDRLVKRHGQQVHLDAVQRALELLPQVHACAVMLCHSRLVAFIVPSTSAGNRALSTEDVQPLAGDDTHSSGYAASSSMHLLPELANPTSSVNNTDFTGDQTSSLGSSFPGDSCGHLTSFPRDLQREILHSLSKLLPSQGVPDTLIPLRMLPTSTHGKVCFDELLDFYGKWRRGSISVLDKRDSVAGRLQTLWRDALGLPEDAVVSADASFLLSGGDSLQCLRLCDDVASSVGVAPAALLEVLLSGSFSDVVSHVATALFPFENSEITEPTTKGLTIEMPLPRLATNDTAKLPFREPAKRPSVESPSTEPAKRPSVESPSTEPAKRPSVESPSTEPAKRPSVESPSTEPAKRQSVESPSTEPAKRPSEESPSTEPAKRQSVESPSTEPAKRPSVESPSTEPAKRPSVESPSTEPAKRPSTESPSTEPAKRPSVESPSTEPAKRPSVESPSTEPDKKASCVSQERFAGRHCRFVMLRRAGEVVEMGASPPLLSSQRETLTSRKDLHLQTTERSDARAPSLHLHMRWTSDTGRCVDASPVLLVTKNDQTSACNNLRKDQPLEKDEVVVYIGSHSHRFQAVDFSTGHLRWERVLGGRIESSAVVSRCGRFIAVGCYDGQVYFLCADTGGTHWMFSTGDAVKSCPAVDMLTGWVVIGSHDGRVYALDLEARHCIWTHPCGGGGVFSSPCFHPSLRQLYVATLGGRLLSLNADTGAPLWMHSTETPFFSSPQCCDRCVCIGSVDGNLHGFSHAGEKVWQFSTSGPIFSSPCPMRATRTDVANQRVVCGSHDGCVYCVNGSDGTLVWRFRTGARVFSCPFAFDGSQWGCTSLVVVSSTDGTLWLLDGDDGALRASLQLPGELFSSPVLWQDSVVVGCRNDLVYCIDIIKQKELDTDADSGGS